MYFWYSSLCVYVCEYIFNKCLFCFSLKMVQWVTWALKLYRSHECGWFYNSTNWWLAVLSNGIPRKAEFIHPSWTRLAETPPSCTWENRGQKMRGPADRCCCQWASLLGAGSLDSGRSPANSATASRLLTCGQCRGNRNTPENPAEQQKSWLCETLKSELFQ